MQASDHLGKRRRFAFEGSEAVYRMQEEDAMIIDQVSHGTPVVASSQPLIGDTTIATKAKAKAQSKQNLKSAAIAQFSSSIKVELFEEAVSEVPTRHATGAF